MPQGILAICILVLTLGGVISAHLKTNRLDQVKTELAIARIDSTLRLLRSDVRFIEDRVSGVQDTILMHEAEIKSLRRKVVPDARE